VPLLWVAIAVVIAGAVGGGRASAQAVDERWVPAGAVRWGMWPSFASWHERFGGPGEPGRVGLGEALSGGGVAGLFPGGALLAQEIGALTGNGTYTPTLGALDGRLQYDVTRIDFGVQLGITDWLSVGATVPRVKARSALDLVFQPDTIAGDLGVTPWLTARTEVENYLAALGASRGAAEARAVALCGAADPGCAAATELSERAARFDQGLARLYTGSPFFPHADRATGLALTQALGALDASLVAAGLPAVGRGPVLADTWVTEADLATLPVRWGGLGYVRPLAGRLDLWGWGDVEVSALLGPLRLGTDPLEGGRGALDVYGGLLLRLGTGTAADPDTPLALATGDGQTDIEGRLMLDGRYGPRWSVRAGGRYGTQSARDLVVRARGDGLLPAAADRVVALWEPAPYWSVDMEPGFRLADPLTLAGHWRYAHHGADRLSAAGSGTGTGAPVTPAWPTRTGAWGRHEAGVSFGYDTVHRSAFEGARALRVRVRVVRALGGTGDLVPAETRVDLGAELVMPLGLWGG